MILGRVANLTHQARLWLAMTHLRLVMARWGSGRRYEPPIGLDRRSFGVEVNAAQVGKVKVQQAALRQHRSGANAKYNN